MSDRLLSHIWTLFISVISRITSSEKSSAFACLPTKADRNLFSPSISLNISLNISFDISFDISASISQTSP